MGTKSAGRSKQEAPSKTLAELRQAIDTVTAPCEAQYIHAYCPGGRTNYAE